MFTKKINSPILFLIFNRPEKSNKVFERIREVKPSKLYIASDGPREHIKGEPEKVMESRLIINQIDWDCEVFSLFRNENLGCRDAVSGAINWFFSNEEQGIILEDDCLPSRTFFSFCDEMLERFKYDSFVSHISGTNTQGISSDIEASYYFSNINNIWGWASWRRVWQMYDVDMKDYQVVRQELIENLPKHFKFYVNYFDNALKDSVDTWDFQYNYAFLKNGLISIIPKFNLVSNIGFSKDATHTKDTKSALANIPSYDIDVIIHPKIRLVNSEKDKLQLRKSDERSPLAKGLAFLLQICKRFLNM